MHNKRFVKPINYKQYGPNVNMSPAEVMDFYSMNYPELTTATVHGPEIEDDRVAYEFKTTIGVKG